MKAPTEDGNLPDRYQLVVVPPALYLQWQQEIRRYVKYGAVDLFPYEGVWAAETRKQIWDEIRARGRKRCEIIILAKQPVRTLRTLLDTINRRVYCSL